MRFRSLRSGVASVIVISTLVQCHERGLPPPGGAVWMHVGSAWTSPPPEVQLEQQSATVVLMRFDEDGRFSTIGATVIRQRGEYTISDGDGVHISGGTWEHEGEGIVVRYRTLYRTARLRPDDTAEWKTDRIHVARDVLTFRQSRFAPSAVTSAEYERVFERARR